MQPTALITGASMGIGRELALVLAERGYHLGLLARKTDLLVSLKEEIKKRFPTCEVFVASCDVTQIEACQKTIGDMASALGQLDLFIANAGIGVQTPAWKSNYKHIHDILMTNVVGAIASIETAKDIMIKQGFGHVVGVSSVAGFRGLPTSSGYSTSKVALTAYLESIRLDLKKMGIGVTSIHPGFVDTPMTQKNKYAMPFIMPADQAALIIYKAIQRKKRRFIFPWQMKVLITLMRILPDCLYDALMGLFIKRLQGSKKTS
ncbi:SDR family NAD(P)-dependent oxidoreductase [candidate division KSB1 bacterium]|nr:SDR family NAD(P)-dependent oxidoreductase [candidate division KSB1 bacterium]